MRLLSMLSSKCEVLPFAPPGGLMPSRLRPASSAMAWRAVCCADSLMAMHLTYLRVAWERRKHSHFWWLDLWLFWILLITRQ